MENVDDKQGETKVTFTIGDNKIDNIIECHLCIYSPADIHTHTHIDVHMNY